MPPTQVAMRAPPCHRATSSRLTCKASSRVGAMISASGASAMRAVRRLVQQFGAMARPKATVLPEPVWAETIRSRCDHGVLHRSQGFIAAFGERFEERWSERFGDHARPIGAIEENSE
jgi:hypothetical protein